MSGLAAACGCQSQKAQTNQRQRRRFGDVKDGTDVAGGANRRLIGGRIESHRKLIEITRDVHDEIEGIRSDEKARTGGGERQIVPNDLIRAGLDVVTRGEDQVRRSGEQVVIGAAGNRQRRRSRGPEGDGCVGQRRR